MQTPLLSKALTATSLSAAVLCATGPVLAQPSRIAVVNSELVLRDSLPAKEAQSKLAQEFSRRDSELQDLGRRVKALADKLEKDATVLTDFDRHRRQREVDELNHEFQRKQREFREDLQLRRDEELARVQERAHQAIRQLAEQRRYDLIIQDAVYVNPRIDITADVMKELDASSR